jgi:hypothetical protein
MYGELGSRLEGVVDLYAPVAQGLLIMASEASTWSEMDELMQRLMQEAMVVGGGGKGDDEEEESEVEEGVNEVDDDARDGKNHPHEDVFVELDRRDKSIQRRGMSISRRERSLERRRLEQLAPKPASPAKYQTGTQFDPARRIKYSVDGQGCYFATSAPACKARRRLRRMQDRAAEATAAAAGSSSSSSSSSRVVTATADSQTPATDVAADNDTAEPPWRRQRR